MQDVVGDLEILALEVDPLAAHQHLDDLQPLLAVGIALVVLAELHAGVHDLLAVPGVDQIQRHATMADRLDLHRHLGQHHRVIEHRLDGGDDLEAARQRRDRRRRGPGFELVEILAVRIGRVLGDQHAVVAQLLGLQHELLVALPRGVVRLERVVQRSAVAVNQRPDADAQRVFHAKPLVPDQRGSTNRTPARARPPPRPTAEPSARQQPVPLIVPSSWNWMPFMPPATVGMIWSLWPRAYRPMRTAGGMPCSTSTTGPSVQMRGASTASCSSMPWSIRLTSA